MRYKNFIDFDQHNNINEHSQIKLCDLKLNLNKFSMGIIIILF